MRSQVICDSCCNKDSQACPFHKAITVSSGVAHFWCGAFLRAEPEKTVNELLTESANTWDRSKQFGGTHYNAHKIQPWDIIDEYSLSFYSGAALKYLLRNKSDKVQDLEKAIHCIEHEIYLLKQKQSEKRGI